MTTKSTRTVGVIPARLESARLPNNPILDICGFPMIAHVYLRSLLAEELDDLYVATDSNEIQAAIEAVGGKVIRTSSTHPNGTSRIAEAASNIEADIIVNIQGDEALLRPTHIDKAIHGLIAQPHAVASILVNQFQKRDSPSDIKVVLNQNNEIMYCSRSDIPYQRENRPISMLKAYHIVPFRKSFLLEYTSLEPTTLEKIESNEYIRILEHGYKIHAVEVDSAAISVDTPEDLAYVRKEMPKDPLFRHYKSKFI